MNTQSRDERRSALDQFAESNQPQAETRQLMTVGGEMMAHGAMAVAVHRDEAKVLQRLKTLAAAAGENFYYRYPVKNRKTGETEWIEGPTIKLANDLARIYGNCETDVRVQDLGEHWIFYSRFIDLESGYSLTRPFQQRKSASKIGGTDDERRLDISFQIGASKAIRNVIVNALQTFADFAFDEAKNALVDRIGKRLDDYRARTAEQVSKHVDLARVEAVVGRVKSDWLAPDIAKIIAMMKAVSDGMATIDETFPPLVRETAPSTKAGLDEFAEKELNLSSETTQGDKDGASASKPHPDDEPPVGAADDALAASSAASKDLRKEAIDKLMKVATDETLTQDQRLETLRVIEPDWLDYVPNAEDFMRACFDRALQVARGELPEKEARKYLNSLKR